MLGSRTDAEDIAQEALLRVRGPVERGEVEKPEAFTTTVATRLAIDQLRSARVRRERYTGPWLPEPVIEGAIDPAELADTLSYALLVVLETLGPVERAAFLLREVFGFDYAEVAAALDRSEPACRQLVARARRRIGDRRPRVAVDPVEHRRLVERFLAAAAGADVDGLVDLLTEDVQLVSDGGPHRRAARRPVLGRDRVLRFLLAVVPRQLEAALRCRIADVNGEPGWVLEDDDGIVLAGTLEAVGGRITAIRWVINPDKLPHG
jgi:RNA polymerase sigma-70 factor (ECF subfamily)